MINPKILKETKDGQKVFCICELVHEQGGKAFLVGGSVRDCFLGNTAPDEFDVEVFGIETSKLEKLLNKNFKVDLIGKSYAVYKIKGSQIDISLPRCEVKTGQGHQAFEVCSDATMSVRQAAFRRDFTINAIYYDPIEDRFEDPFSGIQDLEKKTLRHHSSQFSEDPLRPLRAMQFIARFDLNPAEETVRLCQQISIENLPEERLFGEWEKMLLKGKSIGKGLEFLRSSGWIDYFPELQAMPTCPQEPKWHPEGSVWNHTKNCLDAFAKNRIGDSWEDLVIGLAVLLHDTGKCVSTIIQKGRIRSPMHDQLSVPLAEQFLRRITKNKKLIEEVLPLVKYHMLPFQLYDQNSSTAAVKRLAAKVLRLDRLIRVSNADFNGRLDPYQPESPHALWLRKKSSIADVANSAPKPLVRGRDLICLGLKPSSAFKEILNIAYELQLNEEFSETEEGLCLLQKQKNLKKYFATKKS